MGWTLVTGAGRRLGADICRYLAAQGYDLVVHYNTSKDQAAKVVEDCRSLGVKAESIQGDFSSPEGTERFLKDYLKRFIQTSHLINNVGNYVIESTLQMPVGDWKELFQTNFFAPLTLIQALAPSLKQAEGSIINIGTAGLGTKYSNTYATAYFSTKFNLWMLTRSLARELAPSQVRVNMVSPGMLDIAVDATESPDSLPMKRMGTTEEVARAVGFLMDPQNRYITGQNIEVAGGLGL